MILVAMRTATPSFAPKAGIRLHVKDAIRDLDNRCPNDRLHDSAEKRSPRILELIKKIPHNGGSRLSLGPDSQLRCHQKSDGFKDVYGRMAWNAPAPTLTSGCVNPSRGRFLHPRENRAITLREAALLQSFPIDYQFPLSRGKYAAARLIGNALPPEFIRRLAVEVRGALEH